MKSLFLCREMMRVVSLKYSRLCSVSQREQSTMNVFDRKAKRTQRNRAVTNGGGVLYDYVRDEISYRLADRVYDIKRKFDVGADLGCGKGFLEKHLSNDAVGVMHCIDSASEVLKYFNAADDLPCCLILADEEYLPFQNDCLDLVISSLSLHWVNDLPGTFRQIHNVLKKDGVFLGAMFGGDTLYELRCSLQLAELEREGGFAAHVSPFTAIQDVGSLLNRAGFTMLTVDVDELKVNFPSMIEVLWDVKGMGEGNAAWNRKSHLHRDTLVAAASIYKEMYGNADGTVPATFQVIYMIGWKPDASQPQAAKRGSATVSMKDLASIHQRPSRGKINSNELVISDVGKWLTT